jgi:hypothetical protein
MDNYDAFSSQNSLYSFDFKLPNAGLELRRLIIIYTRIATARIKHGTDNPTVM